MVGSSAMLAEAAHSAADTLNQGFLLTSVHRGARPAEDVADEVDRLLSDRLPLVPHVFLDPTQAPSGSRPAAPR